MKKILFLVFVCSVSYFVGAAEIDSFTKDFILTGIHNAQEPIIKENYIIFTANKTARFVGIVFANERFQMIHSFERIVLREDDGKEADSFLFYIYELPQKTARIDYRLVIDGLWTFDPLNKQTIYDTQNNLILSTVEVNLPKENKTEILPNGMVRFVVENPSGEQIRLSGSFNNWDSYMYIMNEEEPGIYSLELPLPKGIYYYTFCKGIKYFVDKTNSKLAYTKDGKHVSILEIK